MTQQKEQAPSFLDGEGTDGRGSPGMVEEKIRLARGGETGTTGVGMEGDDTDGAGSGGVVQNQNEETEA